MNKLQAVEVDYGAPDLSIEPEMLERLHREVQVKVINQSEVFIFSIRYSDCLQCRRFGKV